MRRLQENETNWEKVHLQLFSGMNDFIDAVEAIYNNKDNYEIWLRMKKSKNEMNDVRTFIQKYMDESLSMMAHIVKYWKN